MAAVLAALCGCASQEYFTPAAPRVVRTFSTAPHNKGGKRGRAGTTVAFFSAVGARHAVPSRTPACGRSR
ncbi:MAG: hypothetical protein ABIF71_02300 [Planctomycetota bacterium]